MALKPDNKSNLKDIEKKKVFLDQIRVKHNELSKRQRDYMEFLSNHYKTRADTMIDKSLQNTINSLHLERNELRAQISVANNVKYIRQDKQYRKEIKCHVNCQEHLAKDIDHLKVTIHKMERALSHVNKEINELNLKIVPETQHQEHVAKTRKKLDILKNRLEVGVRQESKFNEKNARFRKELKNILYDRSMFNKMYIKLIQCLNSNKKYMGNLIEYAQIIFDNCINVEEKINVTVNKYNKEVEAHKTEIQNLMRSNAAYEEHEEFVIKKIKSKKFAPLQPKELKRRMDFKNKHIRKIEQLTLNKKELLEFIGGQTLPEIIERYEDQSSLFTSYFNLDNERAFHLTLLDNSVNRLFTEVRKVKVTNHNKTINQLEQISILEGKLEKQLERTKELNSIRQTHNKKMSKFLGDMQTIFQLCYVDDSMLQALLSDHTQITLDNMRSFAKLLENRIIKVIASIYVNERKRNEDPLKFTVQDIIKCLETQTNLSDIVLTQQCPECAEGEALTNDEIRDEIKILTACETRRSLYNKVTQPEMQYRLHSISQCRLPRSRMLTAKRNF